MLGGICERGMCAAWFYEVPNWSVKVCGGMGWDEGLLWGCDLQRGLK